MAKPRPPLRWFRFRPMLGGLANDWDELGACFAFRDPDHLQAMFAALALPWRSHATCPPQPLPGQSYPGTVQFVALIPGTRWVEQAGLVELCGQRVFPYVRGQILDLTLAGTPEDPYAVGPAQFTAAARIERTLLAPLVANGILVPQTS